ncbi:hypothetical protein KGEDBEEJ_01666 [Aeromonas hydrophila]
MIVEQGATTPLAALSLGLSDRSMFCWYITLFILSISFGNENPITATSRAPSWQCLPMTSWPCWPRSPSCSLASGEMSSDTRKGASLACMVRLRACSGFTYDATLPDGSMDTAPFLSHLRAVRQPWPCGHPLSYSYLFWVSALNFRFRFLTKLLVTHDSVSFLNHRIVTRYG